MVILEPDMEGCSVINGLKVTYIKGLPQHIVKEVIIRTCCGTTLGGSPRQIIPITIIDTPFSKMLKYELKSFNLDVISITPQHIDLVFPIIDKGE